MAWSRKDREKAARVQKEKQTEWEQSGRKGRYRYTPKGAYWRTRPPITPSTAAAFAKVLSSGVDPARALDYLYPDRARGRPLMVWSQHKTWEKEWMDSPLVAEAITTLNGGKWEELDHETRMTLALDHLDTQMAYFLYHVNYNDPEAPLGKIADAREALKARLRQKDGEEGGFERMMRDLLEGKLTQGPPQLQELPKSGVPVPTLRES